MKRALEIRQNNYLQIIPNEEKKQMGVLPFCEVIIVCIDDPKYDHDPKTKKVKKRTTLSDIRIQFDIESLKELKAFATATLQQMIQLGDSLESFDRAQRNLEFDEQSEKQKPQQRYIYIDGTEVFSTNWFQPENHYKQGATVIDLAKSRYYQNGNWKEIQVDDMLNLEELIMFIEDEQS